MKHIWGKTRHTICGQKRRSDS